MNQCPKCGYIDLESLPVVKDTYALLLRRGTLTTSEIANERDTSLQNAHNRLMRLRDLGLAWSVREPQESGGYQNTWRPTPQARKNKP